MASAAVCRHGAGAAVLGSLTGRRREPGDLPASRLPSIPGLTSLSVIGVGGSAIVYRATQTAMGRPVAVKLFNGTVGDKARDAFADECHATGRLSKHPNIVTVFGSGLAEGMHPYLLLEHYDGGSLYDRVASSGPLLIPEVLRLGVGLSAALAAAHGNAIIHRDVTPANVFLSDFGDPVLGDFGIASVRVEGPVVGGYTPDYAAPEVLLGSPSAPASDVYGLSATLYHLLVGSPPQARGATEAYELMGARLQRSARPAAPWLASEVDRAVLGGLEPNPADRPPSALALGRGLQAVQRELGLEITELRGDDAPPRGMAVAPPRPAAPARPAPVSTPDPVVVAVVGDEPAPLGTRAQAAVVDVALSLATCATGVLLSQAAPRAPLPTAASAVAASVLVHVAYHLGFAGLVGATPGRWIAGLELHAAGQAGRVPVGRAALRVLVAFGATLPLGAGYLTALRPPHRTWPDVVSGVSVVERRAEAPVLPFALTMVATVLVGASLAVVAVHLG